MDLPPSFRGGVVPARLTRFREKITLLSRTELDRVLCLPFNERTAAMDAEVVVEDLIVGRLGVRYLVVGDDFRFGQGARGDFAMLEAAGERHGFGVSRMQTLTADDERISSTRVREALQAGDFAEAERLLAPMRAVATPLMLGMKDRNPQMWDQLNASVPFPKRLGKPENQTK